MRGPVHPPFTSSAGKEARAGASIRVCPFRVPAQEDLAMLAHVEREHPLAAPDFNWFVALGDVLLGHLPTRHQAYM